MKLMTLIAITALCFTTTFSALSFAQEIPTPGTKIDKNNYKKYAHLFPEEFLPAFTDGFNGLLSPIEATVMASQHVGQMKSFLDYSAKNKGKYSIDAQGHITPFFNKEGLPFPDLKTNDKDFMQKLMWNFDSKYQHDDLHDTSKGGSYEKRRGEALRWNTQEMFGINFTNRMVEGAKTQYTDPYRSSACHD